MTERRQRKIIRWIRKFTTAQDTSEKNSEAAEPRMGTVVESEYPPSPYTKTDDKTKNTHERVRTALTGVAVIVSIFAYCAARQSATFAGKTADAAQKNVATAQAALKATIENARLDQRAWVGVVRGIEKVIEVGSPLELHIMLRNSGKTPAKNVSPLIRAGSLLSIQKLPVPPPYDFETHHNVGTHPQGKFVIQPGAEVRTVVPGLTFSQGDIDELRGGVRAGYIYGKISYDDVFNNPHCAMFCLRLDSDLTDAYFCDTYNDETDDRCAE